MIIPHFRNSDKNAIAHLTIIKPIVCFGWVFEFYGISTFVGYLMPNSVICIYIQPKISKRILSR